MSKKVKYIDNKLDFGLRLANIREKHDISARTMSLELGMNKNYMNNIESGNGFPSMNIFLNICDYYSISPMAFFDMEFDKTDQEENLLYLFRQLDDVEKSHFIFLLEDLTYKKTDY